MAENNVRTLKVCLQQRSSKVTWNYTWYLTLLKSPRNLHVTLHLHYTFHNTIENFSARCKTSCGIKLAASQADGFARLARWQLVICNNTKDYFSWEPKKINAKLTWLPLPVKGLEIGKNWTNLSSPGRPLTKRSSLVRWSQISHYWWQIPVHQRQTTLHQTDIHPDINTTSNVKTTLVWNRVKILRTGRHTTTKNSQESFIDWNVKPVGGRGGGMGIRGWTRMTFQTNEKYALEASRNPL